MDDFRKQLKVDFEDYRSRFPNLEHIEKDEWAFNFWVLDKLFSVEEELIEECIVDYNDKGIDCFVWHEDTRDLYLIQNKYYNDDTKISKDYLMNDFLTRAIGALEKGTYTRSETLQKIYNKYHEDEDFCINSHLYVTNNTSKTQSLIDAIANYNEDHAEVGYTAKLFSLDDIEEAYYGEPIKERVSFDYILWTINKGTELVINNEAYKMTQALDAKYVLTPVLCIYDMVKKAKTKKYPLFEDNIREFLGSNGQVNKAIKKTLESPIDRRNFFFYNNGITMIVNDFGTGTASGKRREFRIDNPQIVNGCQTVSTIYETLSGLNEAKLEEEFKDTYVMLKILRIPSRDSSLKELYKNIVTYNNSQNAINEKAFVAASDVFKRVQTELEGKGFLLCIKQSDKHTFSEKYKTITPLKNLNKQFLTLFGLEELSNRNQFTIQLEKFLQVLLSFKETPQNAVQNKNKLLVHGSKENESVIEFIRNPALTSNDYLYLYLLYLRAEKAKRSSEGGRMPNPFYLIYCFANYECAGDINRISTSLDANDKVNNIINKYTLAIKQYYKKWIEKNEGKEYNDMIKAPLDKALMDRSVEDASDMIKMMADLAI